MKLLLLLPLLILLMGFPLAYAHPFLIDSVPVQGGNVPAGTTKIITYYSEAVEIDFSEIKIYDSNGNQIDNRDTAYHDGEESLSVTTSPLEDGVYTITSKVLSKVDGHLVQAAIVFGVGEVTVDVSLLEGQEQSETTFLPEAAARFPGLVGQTIVLGAAISSIVIWSTQRRNFTKEDLSKINFKVGMTTGMQSIQQTFNAKFSKITGVGLVAVLASNFAMLAVQTIRLEVSPMAVIDTGFGFTWLVRMIITIILLGIWFWMERGGNKSNVPMLVLSLALIGTTTMMGHGAASELAPPIILDYVHNLLASVWIGGVIFFVFAILPSLASLGEKQKESLTLALLPRYSGMFVIALGILIITGPMLLWFLESNVTSLTESNYGMLIMAKIILAIIMIGFGGYHQFKIQKAAEKNFSSGKSFAYNKLSKPLKVEAMLGIALLAVVALLVNSSLPAGEVQTAEAQGSYGFSSIFFSEQAKFDVTITPVGIGSNTITVLVTTFDDKPLSDIAGMKIKISNPQRGIAPIITEVTESNVSQGIIKYTSETTFGFAGTWQIELEAQRTENANESVFFNVLIKPALSDIRTDITEYEFPVEDSAPLYPLFDGKDIWISDAQQPRLWKFSIDDEEFTSYTFDGISTIFLDMDQSGKIWFTDTPNSQIGSFNPSTEKFEIIKIPQLHLTEPNSIPIAVEVDHDDDIWIALVDKHSLLEYDQQSKTFDTYSTLTAEAGPSALKVDNDNNIWFAESFVGKLGKIDGKTGEMIEYQPSDGQLAEPFGLMLDKDGNIWISEHAGPGLAKFDPILESFDRVIAPNPQSLPFGMVLDKYDNIWSAQHVIDYLLIHDPYNNRSIEVPIPTAESFTQFVTSDDDGNVWFVEQRGQKLGKVSISAVPGQTKAIAADIGLDIKYVELVAPLVAAGIIATALFFVKSIHDKRRIDKTIENETN